MTADKKVFTITSIALVVLVNSLFIIAFVF